MPVDKPIIYKDAHNFKIEYYTYGKETGYPVLYMHGSVPMPFSKELSDLISELNLYVIVILRPGYGSSTRLQYKNIYEYALVLRDLITKLQLQSFDVLGLSAGAPYCYALAAAYPDLVNHVHICSGIPLVNNKSIFHMNSKTDKFMFSLSKYLPAGFIGKYGLKAMAAQEKKKGWQDAECGETMDVVFEKYVNPNWYGIGYSTTLQYKYWGFDAETITNKVFLYQSKSDELIPFEIALKSASLLKNSQIIAFETEDHSSEKILFAAIRNIEKQTTL
ncbi:MAG: alpha/beta hydrolase [Mobilitalea sp.]